MASVMSRSQSQSTSGTIQKDIINSLKGGIDLIFPIYEEMVKQTHISNIFHYLALLINAIQFIVQCIWPYTLFEFENNSSLSNIFAKFVEIVFFFDPENKYKFPEIQLIVTVCAFVLTIAIAGVELGHYRTTLGFNKPLLYTYRVMLEFIVPIFLLPSVTICSNFLAGALLKEYDMIYIVFAVLMLIPSIGFFALIRIHYSLISVSPYLQHSPLTAIVYSTPLGIWTIAFIMQFLQIFLDVFPKWASSILCLIHGALFGYYLVNLNYLPFLKNSTNVIYAALIVGAIGGDLFSFIQSFYQIFVGLQFFVIIVCVIVAAIVYHYLFKSIKKKAEKDLKKDPENTGENTYRNKFQVFDDLYLDYNPKRFIFYLQIAIGCESDAIIPDGTLFMYALEKYQDYEVFKTMLIFCSFVPGFNKAMSLIFKHIFAKKNMSYSDRFLIFAVMRIKILRQSSVSSQFSDSIISVRQETKKCRDLIKGFMLNTPDYVSFFNSFYSTIQSANNHWIEFTSHFPNSSKAYDEYAEFLVDVMTDFKSATIQKHKTALIDDGHRLHKDWAYRSFIHWWPSYLKKGITDMHGNFVEKKRKRVGSQHGTSHSHTSTTSLTSVDQLLEIAPEEEEMYAKSLFGQHKLRLAYQRALEGRVSMYSSKYKICALVVTIISIFALVTVDLIYGDYFSSRASSITEVKRINYARFYMSTVRFISYLYYSEKNGKFVMGEDFKRIVASDPNGKHYIDFTGRLMDQALSYVTTGNDDFNQFIDMLVQNAIDGNDIYTSASIFLKQQINVSFCHQASKSDPAEPIESKSLTSLKALYSYESVETQHLFVDECSTWPTSLTFCGIVNNIKSLSGAFDQYVNKQVENEKQITEDSRNFIMMFEIILPLALAVVCILCLTIPLGLYYSDLKQLLKVFLDIPTKMREEISEAIKKDENEENASSSTIPSTSIFVQLFAIAIILTLISPVILFLCYWYAQTINSNFESLTDWMNIGGSRAPVLSEAIEHISLAILRKDNPNMLSVDQDTEVSLASQYISELVTFHSATTDGSGSVEPCNGFDDVLDELHFSTSCEADSSVIDQHERYRCASLSQDVAFVKTFMDDVIAKFDSIDRCDDLLMLEIYHIANTHMYNKLFDVSERLDTLGGIYENKFKQFCNIFMWVGICLQVICCIVYIAIGIKFDHMYETGLVLMRRISPTLLIQNREIMDLIMNKHKKGNTESMTFSQNIIFSSTDGVLFLNKNGIIEMVNNSINDILGYVPDQILGQNVALIFPESSAAKVSQQLVLMKNNEAKDIFDDHLECVSDNTSILQCHVTILGLTNQGQSEISTFVMFIRDESILLKKQEAAEKAKKQSEDLLFEILPRDIVFKLNQGENDITFAVPNATIMFIDIVRFSDYAANLTPQQIMGNLSLIFDSFDKHLTDYKLITKIKLIGDVYMCASGLFMPKDSNPQDHAEQMLHFALDCLQDIENTNVQLESMLAVRIGVNTGGPVIGGVLGTDKPVFDIIGDPINVASRLQSTDIPGKVQIPQSTFDLVHNLDFIIEKRGEVFLKGKGNVTTYLVSPVNIFNMTTNTITSSMVLNTTSTK